MLIHETIQFSIDALGSTFPSSETGSSHSQSIQIRVQLIQFQKIASGPGFRTRTRESAIVDTVDPRTKPFNHIQTTFKLGFNHLKQSSTRFQESPNLPSDSILDPFLDTSSCVRKRHVRNHTRDTCYVDVNHGHTHYELPTYLVRPVRGGDTCMGISHTVHDAGTQFP